jgi:NADPH:quinone reductase-like Zn-dependent oxidoreductase
MSSNAIKSLRFAAFGPPSVLRVEEVPMPEPGDGEALVHVKAAAINPSDIRNVAGHFKKTTLRGWFHTKKIQASSVASAQIAGESKISRILRTPNMVSAMQRRGLQ